MKLNRLIIGIVLSLSFLGAMDIYPQVSGEITYLKHTGESVKKGDVIIKIDPKQIIAKLQEAKARLHYLKIILDDKKLLKSQNQALYDSTVLAKRDLDTIVLQTSLAQAQYDAQKAKVNFMKLEVKKYTIQSPINGKISKIPNRRNSTNIYKPQILMVIEK